MESEFFDKEKVKIKDLIIELEENEDVLKSIKEAFKQYNISKGEIIELKGYMKNINLNYFQRSNLKHIQIIEPKKIVKASGEFKYDFINNALFGRIRVIYEDHNKNFEGIITKAKAVEGLKITIRYLEVLE